MPNDPCDRPVRRGWLGGWDIGARAANIHTIGIEHDATACATRAAAQLATIRADLYHYPPQPCEGLIASPPCPAFSTAGKRAGHDDIEALQILLAQPTIGSTDRQQWADPSSELIAQTARWAHLATGWVTLEQVPPVLPIWQALAKGLRSAGWRSAWAGVLNSADYGVPQTRRRAILIAHRSRVVGPPEPTHTETPTETLFGSGLLPWVSMAEAIGWGRRKPAPTIVSTSFGGGRPLDGDSGIRAILKGERERGEWVVDTRRDQRPDGTTQTRQVDQPAPTLTAKSGSQWVLHPGSWADGQHGEGTVRLEPWQAGVLQSFQPDYPWQGTRTAQFRQIGNAVPPLLAQRILETITRQHHTRQGPTTWHGNKPTATSPASEAHETGASSPNNS